MTVLMCEPSYFDVKYTINPWMKGHIGKVHQARAHNQWYDLYNIISRLTDIELIPPGKNLPDMCFAANAGLIRNNIFVPTKFKTEHRSGEMPYYYKWFEQHEYNITKLQIDVPFEGEGDALFQPNEDLLWAGYGFRSSCESHKILSTIFDVEVISLQLIDPKFYHLDTCFCPLPNKKVMYYPQAFNEQSRIEIERRVKQMNRIIVSTQDALNFACNSIQIDDIIISNSISASQIQLLKQHKYRTIPTPLDEFLLAGGAAKCLTLTM